METKSSEKEVSYPVFKGLQKPLEFLGLRGRYIMWAIATFLIGFLGFVIFYASLNFLSALIFAVVVIGIGVALIMMRQQKGLHSKKVIKGIFIVARRIEYQ